MTFQIKSLEDTLVEMIRRDANSISILQSLEKIYNSDEDFIEFHIENQDGTTNIYTAPSYSYVISKLNSLEQTVKNFSGFGDTTISIRLPDGSFRTLVKYEIPSTKPSIRDIRIPNYFNYKANLLEQYLTNPFSFVEIDLTGNINKDSKEVKINLFELKLDNESQKNYFLDNLKNKRLNYDEFVNSLTEEGINYVNYNEVIKILPKKPKYKGLFDVITVYTNNSNEKVFRLNKLNYINIENSTEINLKINDELIVVNKDIVNTIYKIKTINLSTNEITLDLVSGFHNINQGVEVLSIKNIFSDEVKLEFPIKSDQNLFLFFKEIDDNFNYENEEWGEGFGLETNSLLNVKSTAVEETFSNFSKNSTKNLANILNGLANENLIPVEKLLEINIPTLLSENFKVEVINDHKQIADKIDNIRKKYSEKQELSNKIANIDINVKNLTLKISNNDLNTLEREKLNNEIKNSKIERENIVKELSSKIEEIITIIDTNVNFIPKYRVKGLFNIPEPRYENETLKSGKQIIIGFDIEYRYLSTKNTYKENSSFNNIIDSGQNSQTAVLSRWQRLPSVIRKKNNNGTWAEENLSNPDEININQVEIPITRGENVEIRVRSISEVGYPYNLNKSEWSNSLIIQFPEELVQNNDALIESAKNDKLLNLINRQLNELNLLGHSDDSFENNEKKFKHKADNISTNELTPENKNKSLSEVLLDLKNEQNIIKSIVNQTKGIPKIYITDNLGNLIKDVIDGETINLFAGYYINEIKEISKPKGEIVTKVFNVVIENVNDGDLEFLSYVPGSYTEKVPNNDSSIPLFYDNYDGYLYNKYEFNNYRKYWKSPLSFRSLTNNNDFLNTQKISKPYVDLPSFQSAQNKSQFLFLRNRDLTLNSLLYKRNTALPVKPNPTTDSNIFTPDFSGLTNEVFIWNGTGSNAGGGNVSDFAVHVDHPDLISNSEFMLNFSDYQGVLGQVPTLPLKTIDSISNPTKKYYPPFIHSYYFHLQSNETDGLVQLEYIDYQQVESSATTANFPKKIGFNLNDKYLIGKKTCGSYLFLAPDNNKSLNTNSLIYNRGIKLTKSENNKLIAKIIYQYRHTDYWGAGDSGLGNIGGDPNLNNFFTAKKIGIDLLIKEHGLISFDIQIESQYKPTSAENVV